MSNTQPASVPVWFWIIGAVALVWNIMGVVAYIQQMTMSPEALAALTAAEQALYATVPAWATGAFAVAVFAGVGGSALLLLRKKIAVPVFWLSATGIVVQMFHAFVIANVLAVMGPASAIMPVIIIVIGAALVWYSMTMKTRGLLN